MRPARPIISSPITPGRKGLVGFNSSYGSEEYTDNHFHYGYFTVASALLAMQDPGFAHDYGPMAKLVAKQYANWDRDDKRFPFLRTFDVWQGHSWAGGVGSGNGANNQESSSEATQSWEGLLLLGQALGDKDMTAAGVMGYNFESQAAMEYWFNAHGDGFPPEWKHPIVGVVWSAGNMYGTWFTGDPGLDLWHSVGAEFTGPFLFRARPGVGAPEFREHVEGICRRPGQERRQ